jgi:hypothetical protein
MRHRTSRDLKSGTGVGNDTRLTRAMVSNQSQLRHDISRLRRRWTTALPIHFTAVLYNPPAPFPSLLPLDPALNPQHKVESK